MFAQRLKELRRLKGVSQVALANILQVSQQAVGKWETGRSSPDNSTLAQLAEIFNVSVDFLLGVATQHSPSVQGEYPIPILGTVKAGFGALAFEEDYGVEYARVKNPENYFYLIVKGDSMEPRIHDGDLALVRRQNSLENGELGVVVYGEGDGTLKKFIKKDNAIILQPFNTSYTPQVLIGDDLNSLFIAGKVVETKTKW